jgi:hypothetical protein
MLFIGLAIGIFLGSNLGILIMCLLQISQEYGTRVRSRHRDTIEIAESFFVEAALQREG